MKDMKLYLNFIKQIFIFSNFSFIILVSIIVTYLNLESVTGLFKYISALFLGLFISATIIGNLIIFYWIISDIFIEAKNLLKKICKSKIKSLSLF